MLRKLIKTNHIPFKHTTDSESEWSNEIYMDITPKKLLIVIIFAHSNHRLMHTKHNFLSLGE